MTFCVESLIEKIKDKVVNLNVLDILNRIVYAMIDSRKHEIRNRVSKAAASVLELDPEKIESILNSIEYYTFNGSHIQVQDLVIDRDPRYSTGEKVKYYAIMYNSAILVDQIPSYEEAERLKELIIFIYEQYRKELELDSCYKSLVNLQKSINRKASELEQEVADLIMRCLQ